MKCSLALYMLGSLDIQVSAVRPSEEVEIEKSQALLEVDEEAKLRDLMNTEAVRAMSQAERRQYQKQMVEELRDTSGKWFGKGRNRTEGCFQRDGRSFGIGDSNHDDCLYRSECCEHEEECLSPDSHGDRVGNHLVSALTFGLVKKK